MKPSLVLGLFGLFARANAVNAVAYPTNIGTVVHSTNLCSATLATKLAQYALDYGLGQQGYSVSVIGNGEIEIECSTKNACLAAEEFKKITEAVNLTQKSGCTLVIKNSIPNKNSAAGLAVQAGAGLAVIGAGFAALA